MKYPLPPEMLNRCRALRKDSTDAEMVLWRLLRDRQLAGAKFRRQHAVGHCVLDFYCHEARLAIEVDGGQHTETGQSSYDEKREAFLDSQGIQVLRFWNHEVLVNPEGVIEAIWSALTPALSRREREK